MCTKLPPFKMGGGGGGAHKVLPCLEGRGGAQKIPPFKRGRNKFYPVLRGGSAKNATL